MGISIEMQPGIKTGAYKRKEGIVFVDSHKKALGHNFGPYTQEDTIYFPHGSQAHLYLSTPSGEQIDFMVYDFRRKSYENSKLPETRIIGLLKTNVTIKSKVKPKTLTLDSETNSWDPNDDKEAIPNCSKFIKSIKWVSEN